MLTTVTITVTIDQDAKTFTAGTLDESQAAPSMQDALAALSTRLVHLHDELKDVPDNDLTQQGKDIRDTPFVFTP